jgi:hypothetical protein
VSTATADELSPVFADNLGSDAIVVFDGPSTWATTGQPKEGPKNFDFRIDFSTAFPYDPSEGPLLVDLSFRGGLNGETPVDLHEMYRSPGRYEGEFEAQWAAIGDEIAKPQYRVYIAQPIEFTLAPELMAGDADRDLDFDPLDVVQVLQSGKYLTGQPATWGEGDWNGAPGGWWRTPPAGDGVFDQLDITAALQGGAYLTGPYAALTPDLLTGAGAAAVPEPASLALPGLGLALVAARRRGSRAG